MEERLTLNVSEAAVKLGVSEPTLYLAIRKGQLPCLKLGKRRFLIPISALERYLANVGSQPVVR